MQVFYRVFPVGRGLYEDKVSNVWCAISVLIKLRSFLSIPALVKLSICSTLAIVLPSCLHLFMNPTTIRFKYALCISSLGFFLFSFQVHEKSILLPMLCITMMDLDITFWFNNIALFSIWPLLKRDGLLVAYISMIIVWNIINSHFHRGNTKSKGGALLEYFKMV